MKFPYVIDNNNSRLVEILTEFLIAYKEQSLDVATAYFNIGGFDLIKGGLQALGSFRMLLGQDPDSGEKIGVLPIQNIVRNRIGHDLNEAPFNEKTVRIIEELIRFLAQDKVGVRVYDDGFLHAKCWLFYFERKETTLLFERFQPMLAIVGSSNFTAGGLTSNKELNLLHKVMLDPSDVWDDEAANAVRWLSDKKPQPDISDISRQLIKSEVGARAIIELESWFSNQWSKSRDFKSELIDLLHRSKFGQYEYSPFEIYMKSLYELFRDDLESAPISDDIRSAIELTQFQEDAVKKARRLLARYNGVMIADSVGLGKTWIGKKLLEDYAYHRRQNALVVCPASLRDMWKRELGAINIHSEYLSQEELGRGSIELEKFMISDVLLIDESHNFRNKNTQRYGNLERIIGGNNGRGKSGASKKIILMTATPINNDLLDLYHQINLITQGDRSYFSGAGIGDLYRYFLQSRAETQSKNSMGVEIFNLLEEIVIRRTRNFIKKAYPDALIRGQKIIFPDRKLRTVTYNLEGTYKNIYEKVVAHILQLKLTHYNLESYKKEGIAIDEMEKGRQLALIGIFKSRFLKRFESSVDAFRISIKRALEFIQTFEDYLLDGKLMKSRDFHSALRFLEMDDDDSRPDSLAEKMDKNETVSQFIDHLERIDTGDFDLRKLNHDVRADVKTFTDIWLMIKDIRAEQDAKLNTLKELLMNELSGKKVLIFTYYKDTARYLFNQIGNPNCEEAKAFMKSLGRIIIQKMDSDVKQKDRLKIVQRFAPKANNRNDWLKTEREIQILISTDVLSEGQNLQDCGYLLNYDLHWNPTRMVQRAGRIDRIGTEFDTLFIYNMFPEEGLEKLLGLVQSLSRKIEDINKTGFLDSSILGETVNPRNFNTLRRIKEEDGTVVDEEEKFSELVSNEFMMQHLRILLNSESRERLLNLPDGIHSGLIKPGSKGIFFYFQGRPANGEKLHFWKYYDFKSNEIISNRFVIANLIAAERETARYVELESYQQVFAIQEQVIKDIISSYSQQQALIEVPKTLHPIQQKIATVITNSLDHPEIDRQSALDAIKFLNAPKQSVQVRELEKWHNEFRKNKDISEMINKVLQMLKSGRTTKEAHDSSQEAKSPLILNRKDLYLICFDFIDS